jgi:hypothetical protein
MRTDRSPRSRKTQRQRCPQRGWCSCRSRASVRRGPPASPNGRWTRRRPTGCATDGRCPVRWVVRPPRNRGRRARRGPLADRQRVRRLRRDRPRPPRTSVLSRPRPRAARTLGRSGVAVGVARTSAGRNPRAALGGSGTPAVPTRSLLRCPAQRAARGGRADALGDRAHWGAHRRAPARHRGRGGGEQRSRSPPAGRPVARPWRRRSVGGRSSAWLAHVGAARSRAELVRATGASPTGRAGSGALCGPRTARPPGRRRAGRR